MIQSQINRNIRLDLDDRLRSAKLDDLRHFAEVADGGSQPGSLRNRGF